MADVTRVGVQQTLGTTSSGYFGALTPLPGGGFMAIWSDQGYSAVVGRVLDSSGRAIGTAFPVFTGRGQQLPEAATLSNGTVVVAWNGSFSDDTGYYPNATVAQIVDPTGAKVGVPFLVGQTGSEPYVAALAGGGFVVTWDSTGAADDPATGVSARFFTATGAPAGGTVHVDTITAGDQSPTGVTALADGHVMITWLDTSIDATGKSAVMRGQLLDARGGKIGGELVISADTAAFDWWSPTVAPLKAGGFVATWLTAGGNGVVEAQRFEASGHATGALLTVTAPGTGGEPTVATLGNGDFVVGWTSGFNSGTISAQAYTASGDRIGAAVQAGSTGEPAITAVGASGFAIGSGTQVLTTQLFSVTGYAPSLAFDYTSGAVVKLTQSGNAVTATQGGTALGTVAIDAAALVLGKYGQLGAGEHIDASALSAPVSLIESNGDDVLIGGSGNDTISAVGPLAGLSGGHDLLTGGGGADDFDFTGAILGLDGTTITDFDASDVIDLNGNTAAGAAATRFIGTQAFDGVAGEYRYYTDAGRTYLQVDLDGDRVPDATLTIANGAFQLLADTGNLDGPNAVVRGASTAPTTGNDVLTGTSGDDVIAGLAGDDTIDGGAGSDVAVFAETMAQASVHYGAVNGVQVVTVTGPDGRDTLTGIETLRFADGSVTGAANVVGDTYLRLGGRDATAAELNYWTGQIAATGSRAGLNTAILNDRYLQVYANTIVTGYYEVIGGRDPSASELSVWRGQLAMGFGFDYVRQAILDDALGTNARGEIALYQQYMGRAPSDAELGVWQQQIKAGATLATVRAAILDDATGHAHTDVVVTSLYQQYIGRAPTAGEVATWQGLVHSGYDFNAVRATMLADPAGRSHTATTIDALYQFEFGRAPTASEASVWTSEVNRPTTRYDSAKFDQMLDVLVRDCGSDATGTVRSAGTPSADGFAASHGHETMITGFDAAHDVLTLSKADVASGNPLDAAHARTIDYYGLNDVLLTLDDGHHVLLANVALADLTSANIHLA